MQGIIFDMSQYMNFLKPHFKSIKILYDRSSQHRDIKEQNKTSSRQGYITGQDDTPVISAQRY